MSDDYENEAPPHPGDPPQQLVDFVGAFTDDQARNVFGDASVRLHDYMTQRQIADDNAAATNRLVSNLGQFKDGLVGMAYGDPAATTLGLDLVPDIVDGLVSANPFLPDDQREGVYSGIASDIQREVARSGVMSLAEKDAGAARALLENERVNAVLDDSDRLALEGHISALDAARTVDAAAVAQQRAIDERRSSNFAAVNYLGALVDPNTQEMQLPGGWAQKIMLDPALGPGDTAGMLGLYERLRTDGDVKRSDPYLMADVIQRMASDNPPDPREILGEAGRGLRVADAVGMARDSVAAMTPAMQREYGELSATIDTAREIIASPENGPAGHAAFGRFMDWLTDNYAGAGSLNPNSENYILPSGGGQGDLLFWRNFAPNNNDIVLGSRLAGDSRNIDQLRKDTGDRMSLDQIFGPKRGETNADTVEHRARIFDPRRIPVQEPPPMMGYAPAGNPTFMDEDGNPGNPRYVNPEVKS